jgi:hypothetical protein
MSPAADSSSDFAEYEQLFLDLCSQNPKVILADPPPSPQFTFLDSKGVKGEKIQEEFTKNNIPVETFAEVINNLSKKVHFTNVLGHGI